MVVETHVSGSRHGAPGFVVDQETKAGGGGGAEVEEECPGEEAAATVAVGEMTRY